ncbi:cupin 2 domain-containing protein [Serratia sp. AS12]|uniref:cupin domain-containing protein n=1 Tax=Serratia TaxID=613 RepID=UPI00020E9B93|nr:MULTISPECIES: cupin domain-containing protein [Serratia]AEF46599.1 cupin 2 domain-containing protein [Serratia plymuthica AS9]AEF51551.1 cupin 2 domain-containing protein [Serratia sp. AS12]AEG29258.1 cupin 2 domain-containing protein [Serratia sp. AS13]MBJ7891300.1 cupin domain-containing protein [Serratia sp. PAMC26656]
MYKLILLALTMAFQGSAQAAEDHGEGISKETLLKTETSWEGTPYGQYPAGAPQITLLKVTVEPNKVLAWHIHPCISAVYMTGGSVSLTVKKTGLKHTFKQGDSFTDTVDIVHQGVSGDKGAEMLVFFACADNKPLTVKTAE